MTSRDEKRLKEGPGSTISRARERRRRRRELGLWTGRIGSIALLLTCLVPGLEVVFALLVPLVPVALLALGAFRFDESGPRASRGEAARLAVALGLAAWLEAVVVTMLVLRGSTDPGPWILGLPAAMAVQVYGLLVVPLPLLVFADAALFWRDESDAEISTVEPPTGGEPESR